MKLLRDALECRMIWQFEFCGCFVWKIKHQITTIFCVTQQMKYVWTVFQIFLVFYFFLFVYYPSVFIKCPPHNCSWTHCRHPESFHAHRRLEHFFFQKTETLWLETFCETLVHTLVNRERSKMLFTNLL